MSKFFLLLSFPILFSCSQSKKENTVDNTTEVKVKHWYNLGISSAQRDHFSIRLYADSIEKMEHKVSNDYIVMGKLLRAFSFVKYAKDNEAYKHFMEANSLLKNSDADSLKNKVLNGLGQYFQTNGDYVAAHKYFVQSLKIAEKSNKRIEIAAAHSNLGDLYLHKNDLKSGNKHLSKALDLLKSKKNRTIYLITSHNMANYCGMTGNLERAMELDKEGLEICNDQNFSRLKVTFLDNKANCFFYTNQLDSSEYYFTECLKLDRINKNIQQESDSYLNLAHVAFARKNKTRTLQYIDSALRLAEKTNYKPAFLKAGEIKLKLYQADNDFKGLSEAQTEFHAIYKELMNEKKEKAIAQYNTIYETEKKEIKLLTSKIQLAKKEKLIQSKNNLLILVSIIIFALLGLGYLLYRQLKMRNLQQKQEFELKAAITEIESQNQLQDQRLRISRDLHDNIGAQLTFIISSVENLNYSFEIKNPKISSQLTKINNFAKSTIIELRDTIWAMNSKQISNEDLKDRIHNFLEKAQDISNTIKFNFTINEKLIHYSFNSLMGINVYRSMQEAVNNAIKYAEATEINISINEEKDQIIFIVSDNGNGFESHSVEHGNGLYNMRKRMEEISGKILIQSTLKQGTKITLICPK